MNPAAERMLGTSIDQLKRPYPNWYAIREDGSRVAPEDYPGVVTNRTGQPQSDVIIGMHTPGDTVIWLSVNSQPLFREGETKPYAVVSSFSDITPIKEAEAQRMALRIERERVDVLNRFLMDASHDLLTPLTIMGTSLYLLKKSLDSDKLLRHTVKLEEQIARIQELFDSMFALSRLEMAPSEFRLQPCDPNLILQDIATTHQPQATAKQQQLTLKLEPDLPRIKVDSGQLKRALEEIISNALHYTPASGMITLSTHAWDHEVVMRVQDTGISIPADQLGSIFEPFYRVDKSRQISSGGAGLGLTIADRIVKAHGGRIEVESTPDLGSTFSVILPAYTVG
jgi:signal transduction histidine kinase